MFANNSPGLLSQPSFGTFNNNQNQPQGNVFGTNSNPNAFGSNTSNAVFPNNNMPIGNNNLGGGGVFGNTNNVQSSPFGANNTAPVFGNNINANKTFGNNIGGGNTVFGNTPVIASPAFGGNNNNTSAFGNTSANSAFGNPNNKANVFGTAGNNTGGSVFGGLNNNNNTFGVNNNNSTFSNNANVFGGNKTTQSSAFNTNTGNQNVFGAPQTNSSPFGSFNNSNNSNNLSSAFGKTNNTLFGQGSNNAGGIGGTTQNTFGNTSWGVPIAPNNQQNFSNMGLTSALKSKNTKIDQKHLVKCITLKDQFSSLTKNELRINYYNQGGNLQPPTAFGAPGNLGGNTNSSFNTFGATQTNSGGGFLNKGGFNQPAFGTGINNAQGSTGGIFGGTNNNSGMFGAGNTGALGTSSNAGMFGAGNNNNSGGVFGGANNSSGGMFGATNSNGGMFGATNNNNSGGVFGGANNNSSGGMFGANSGSAGMFGASGNNSGSGLFGSSNNNTPSFGGNTSGGLFGANNMNSGNNGNTGGMFGQTNNTGGLFGNTPSFGGNNSSNSPGGGFFGANTQNTGGMFGSTNTPVSGGGLFGQSGNNTPSFGNNTSGGLFGAANTQNTGGMFGGANNTPIGAGGLFSSTSNSAPSFGSGQFNNGGNSQGGLFGTVNNSQGGMFGAFPNQGMYNGGNNMSLSSPQSALLQNITPENINKFIYQFIINSTFSKKANEQFDNSPFGRLERQVESQLKSNTANETKLKLAQELQKNSNMQSSRFGSKFEPLNRYQDSIYLYKQNDWGKTFYEPKKSQVNKNITIDQVKPSKLSYTGLLNQNKNLFGKQINPQAKDKKFVEQIPPISSLSKHPSIRQPKKSLSVQDLPILQGYKINPTLQQLANLSVQQIKQVKKVKIYNQFGSIVFKGPISLQKKKLSQCVKIKQNQIQINETEWQKQKYELVFNNFGGYSELSQELKDKLEKKILKWAKKNNFVINSFERQSGDLTVQQEI